MNGRTGLRCAACCTFAASAFFAAQANAALVISKQPTHNMTCSGTVCSATAKNAVLSVKDLHKLLAASDMTLESGTAAQDIVLATPFSWTSKFALGLDASRSVNIDEPLSVEGDGGLALTTNDGGTGGALSFGTGANISFLGLSNPLQINGNSYQLFDSIDTLLDAVGDNPYGYFALAKGFDAGSDKTYKSAIIDQFGGVLDGLGNTISNLQIASTKKGANVGLIGNLLQGGRITDLGLVNVRMSGRKQANVGGVAGAAEGSIDHSYVTGFVGGTKYANLGGLIGFYDADNAGEVVSNSRSAAKVRGRLAYSAGGLIGDTYGASPITIANCQATGNVTIEGDSIIGSQYAGGLVGFNGAGMLQSSIATGKVQGGAGTVAGGLVGYGSQAVTNSYATGDVFGGDNSSVGGLAGEIGGNQISGAFATGNVAGGDEAQAGGLVGNLAGTVEDSYARGSVKVGSQKYAGGLIGYNLYPLTHVYSTGPVKGDSGAVIGGLIGGDFSDQKNTQSYWDTDLSGITDPGQGAGTPRNDPGITGLSTSQLTSKLPAGFSRSVWAESPSINDGLPYLIANPPPK